MYKIRVSGWVKHLDFILLDIICTQIAFCIAYLIRFGWSNPYGTSEYVNFAIIYALVDVFVAVVFESFKNVLKRGWYIELKCVLKHTFIMEAMMLFYLFTVKDSAIYSRITFYLMIPFYIVIDYGIRCLWKYRIRRKGVRENARTIIIVAPGKRLGSCVKEVVGENYAAYRCAGVVASDDSIAEGSAAGVPVVCKYADLVEYVCHEWVDEIFIFMNSDLDYPMELVEDFNQMGITTHVAIARTRSQEDPKQFVERIGGVVYMTKTMNYASARQLFLKRAIDIAGGLVGCLLMVLIMIVVGPIIYLSSPGPIFFAQERIGRNGRKFKMYKFRSMYMDAEERKKELMSRNKIGDGMMFKMDFDPRIIGNRILPDGTKKTGIGQFIRRTSLDEFPQFINVLKGDMSLVGTRPPTIDEWEKYASHHRARMAFRPGITGLWQISGRSNITDFEEVVNLDTKYIDNWSIGQDLKIMLKTVKSILVNEGAM